MTDTNSEDEKRTRTFTVRTSVEGLRKPITSDANDESRVQNDTIFVCMSCDENFLSFRQTLQRINAKSQAVTGEPGRAGSSPIASAATTPQPAGRSIAKYVRPWRAYFEGVGERCRCRADGRRSVATVSLPQFSPQPLAEEGIRKLVLTAVKIDYAHGDKLVQDTLDAARTRHTDTIHEFGSENARILVFSKATQNRKLIRRQISNYRVKFGRGQKYSPSTTQP